MRTNELHRKAIMNEKHMEREGGCDVKKETYLKMTGTIRSHPEKICLVQKINRMLTGIVFLVYPLFLLTLLIKGHPFFLRALIVPFFSFLAVTIFRKCWNAPRPYEKFGVPPVLDKNTQGKSFPSRHVFSVYIIAITVFYCCPGAGILLGILGIGLAVIRVIGGVHEPKDVIAGAVAGICCGLIGYYLIS